MHSLCILYAVHWLLFFIIIYLFFYLFIRAYFMLLFFFLMAALIAAFISALISAIFMHSLCIRWAQLFMHPLCTHYRASQCSPKVLGSVSVLFCSLFVLTTLSAACLSKAHIDGEADFRPLQGHLWFSGGLTHIFQSSHSFSFCSHSVLFDTL